MIMDAIELLGRLGQVEPADQAVVDAALRGLALAARRDTGQDITAREWPGRPGPRAAAPGRPLRVRRRPRPVTAAVAAVAVAAVAALAVVTGIGRAPLPRPAGARPPGQAHPRPGRVTVSGPPRGTPSRLPTAAAILTAFSRSDSDILRVTKIVTTAGEPTLKIVIWVWPADGTAGDGTAGDGTAGDGTVRSRILTFYAGTRLTDLGLTYPATAPTPPVPGWGCDDIFSRPRFAIPPAAGAPGRLTDVSYDTRSWGRATVKVQAANLPTAARLRACLNAGQWLVAGHGVIAGTKVVELVTAGGALRLWVSAATCLPVRLRSSGPDAPDITFTFAFLAPTRANLAMLTPPVPAAFAKRPI
jgi:hypothetical protein